MLWSQNNFGLLFLSLILSSCNHDEKLLLEIDSRYSNLNFINSVDDTPELSILDYLYFYNGGGVAAGDINNDGKIDLYFTANKGSNKLFVNKGNFQFEDITAKSNTQGNSSWNTGVSMVDINGDGWLDIYVCAVVGIHGFNGHNELFVNQKDGTFKEESQKYGLALKSFSTSASFFDYDKDGDLDMFLLNHGRFHPCRHKER